MRKNPNLRNRGVKPPGILILGKIRSRYAVSAAETEEQDIHQTIVIGVAAIVAHAAQADGLMDDILVLVENSTEADIVSVEREIR